VAFLTTQAQTSTCVTPTLTVVTGITSTSVAVAFTPSATATSYTLVYVPVGITPNVGIAVTGTTSPITLTGLTPNTAYSVYIQATCGTSGQSPQSGPLNFRTSCAPNTIWPYSENFDATTALTLPCGYSVLDANTDGKGWLNMTDAPYSAPNAMRYSYSATNAADDWFFTNGLVLQVGTTYQLQFKYRSFSNAYVEALEVKVGLGATVASQTTTLFTNTNITTTSYLTTTPGSGTGQVRSFTPSVTGIYYLGFHATSVVNQFYIYVDDINVTSAPFAVTATTRSIAPGFTAEAAPVPFGEQLTLRLHTLQAGALQLTLQDAVGRVVHQHSTTVPTGASSLVVPAVGTLPAGMYLLTVRQGGNTQVIRVVHE
jgi:hypothetical protein